MVLKPYTYAHASIVSGEQGTGKTNFVVARVFDAYRKNKRTRATEMKKYGEYRTPELKIFCVNVDLYGIPYVSATLAQIIEWLDRDIIQFAIVVIDEGYVGAYNRDPMSNFVKALNMYSLQIRKRRIDFYMIYPISRMADYTYHTIVTERVMCMSYDEKNGMATVQIKKKKEPWRTVTYNARQYQRYFDTDQTVKLPPKKVLKAIQSVS